jgi:L-ribulose-5-phosphate 4-epimerase
VILEEIARMAFTSVLLHPGLAPASQSLVDKHFLRKHGPGAYYGQRGRGE